MAADGSQQRQLTTHPSSESSPSWSPDSQWLTFDSSRTGTVQVWRMSSKDRDRELLTRGPGKAPEWSPDGDHIYFNGINERTGNIWAFSLEDRSERPATNLVGKRGTLGIGPPATDGKFIYFPWRDDLGDIWVMDVGR
jgi:Tol biopolymer transport system component